MKRLKAMYRLFSKRGAFGVQANHDTNKKAPAAALTAVGVSLGGYARHKQTGAAPPRGQTLKWAGLPRYAEVGIGADMKLNWKAAFPAS
jgi:hypothetical protein